MSEWITDRMPTLSDLVGVEREVWYYCSDQGFAFRCHWSDIKNLGEPWQPIQSPAPYVRKRWTVKWDDEWAEWNLLDDNFVVLVLDKKLTFEAAQRIADIYNEEMP
jgi:hypothetical protein